MASAGTGSGPDVAGELFKVMTGIHASRAVSGRCTRTLRPARGAGPTLLQHPAWIDRVHQGWQAACAGGDQRNTLRSAAGHPVCGRVRAGL
jgi:hypothetical protein